MHKVNGFNMNEGTMEMIAKLLTGWGWQITRPYSKQPIIILRLEKHL